MADKDKAQNCCAPESLMGCCKIEALVSVDERGQMVLPKETRDRAKIHPGDKLALVTGERDGEVCCLVMLKAEELTGMVKDKLGPIFQEILK